MVIHSSGGRYMVVDCGGGTVDITVHEIAENNLKEVFKATGGPYGSCSVDAAFEELLGDVLGRAFIDDYKRKRAFGFVDLMIAFEAKKRVCSPYKMLTVAIALPYSLVAFHREAKKRDIGEVINGYPNPGVAYATHGMLRLDIKVMKRLFDKAIQNIVKVRF